MEMSVEIRSKPEMEINSLRKDLSAEFNLIRKDILESRNDLCKAIYMTAYLQIVAMVWILLLIVAFLK